MIEVNVSTPAHNEEIITDNKRFYRTYLNQTKNKHEASKLLADLIVRHDEVKYTSLMFPNANVIQLQQDTDNTIKEYIGQNALSYYHTIKDKNVYSRSQISMSTLFEDYKIEWEHKKNALLYMYNCLANGGLHPEIEKRGESYKRYHIKVTHNYRKKQQVVEYVTFLKGYKLQQDYIKLFENKIEIEVDGKFIPFESILSIHISSTNLLDDELDLFAAKHGFSWNSIASYMDYYFGLCKKETGLIKNPFALGKKLSNERNNSFVSVSRLNELKTIKNVNFDLIKLIRLCEELNDVAINNNYYASIFLARAIVDHVPPIFSCKNFSEVANNYIGTRSFKKSMYTLDTSIRNIADAHIHGQVRQKEVLPSEAQANFSHDLDILLSEIVRVLK